MKSSIIVISAMLLCCTARADEKKPIVEIGSTYVFATDAKEIRGKVISNEGNGWFIIETYPTIHIAVNTNSAFTISKSPGK